jgi:hypothetical protein
MRFTDDWTIILLQRYAEKYPPYAGSGPKIKKSTDDIIFDLSGMIGIFPREIFAFMMENGYAIEFDDGRPVWLLTAKAPENELPE